MAKVLNHGISGKLGNKVYYSINGNSYVKPLPRQKDPRTPEQLAHRFVFMKISQFSKFIYRGVLQPYTFPRPKSSNLAIYNRMKTINGLILSTNEWDPANLKIFEGPLENPGISTAVLTGDTVKVTFDTEQGKEDDVAIAVAYDDTSGRVYNAVGTRSEGSIEVRIYKDKNMKIDALHAYLIFSRPPPNYGKPYPYLANFGSKGIVSTTAYKKVG
jgi:hypothetical protein